MFVHNLWAMPIEDGFAYCEYGALRAAPPLPYPSLQELPDMAETSIIVATSGGTHGGPPHQGPPSLSPGPVHHLASSHPHHSLALSHTNLQHLSTSNSSSTATTNGGLGSSQHISNSNSLNSSVSSNGSGGGGTLVVQPDGSTTTTNTATSTILTVRMIMQGKEVGSIIGKKGDNIKKFREESGAKINISDGSCPERIVTVTGSTENIQRAFGFICKKFEEQDLQSTPTTPKPPVTLRLVVPASQCGSLIGKQGCKIKEIREATGASIQVASEMLPNSTERAVTVSGTADAITECIKYVCGIMLESPPKGANLPYRPKPLLSPLYIPGSQGFTVPASVASIPGQELSKGFPAQPVPMAHAIPMLPSAQNIVPGSLVPINGLGPAAFPPLGPPLGPALGPPLWPGPLPPPPPHQQPPQPPHCLSLGPSLQYTPRAGAPPGPPHQQALPAPPGPQAQEMNIPNDLIGCIIGRGGQKINEIRQVSGATIKISNAEDGSSDRKVTITGPPECIGLAQYLISTSMELHKTLTLDPASLTPVSCVGGALPPMPQHPMAMTVVKPLPPHHPGVMNLGGINGLSGLNGVAAGVNMGATLNGINGLTGMPGLPPFLADPGALTPSPPGVAPPAAATSMAIAVPSSSPLSPGGAKQLQTKMRVGLTATTAFKAAERPKFAPY